MDRARNAEGTTSTDAAATPPPRSLRRAFAVLAAGDVVARLLGFAAYALLARRLEPSPGVYGALEAALATVFGASLLIEGGLGPYGARSLAARPNDGGRLFAEIARLRLVWTLVSVGALCFYAFRVCDDLRVGSFIALYAAGLLASPFLLEWWFQGRNEPAFVAAPQIGRNLGLFAATFFFVDDASDAYFAPIGDALGFFVGVAVQHAAARVPSPLPHLRETRENLVARAKETAPYLAGTLLWALRIFGPIALSARALSGVDRDVFAAAFRLFTSAHALLVLYFMNQLATWTRGLAAPEASWRTVVGGRALRAFAFAGLPAATAYAAGPGGFEAIVRVVFGDALAAAPGAGDATLLLCFSGLVAFVGAHGRFGAIAAGRPSIDVAANAVGAVGVACVLATLAAPSPQAFALAVLVGELCAGVVALLGAAATKPGPSPPPPTTP